jgi:hypothetical protein
MQRIAVPTASLTPLPEVAAYLAPFAPLFRRAESRAGLERYVTGLLTDLPRKNCEAIAAAVAGTSTERLQHLLTDADWDPEALDRDRVRALVAVRPPGGVLVLDETSLPKQGRASVGVQRQYCGATSCGLTSTTGLSASPRGSATRLSPAASPVIPSRRSISPRSKSDLAMLIRRPSAMRVNSATAPRRSTPTARSPRTSTTTVTPSSRSTRARTPGPTRPCPRRRGW